jgi:hypothetical protein
MTRFGKRYVAIVEHPSDSDGPRWNAPYLFKSNHDANQIADSGKERGCQCGEEHMVTVLEVDLDLAAPVSATDEQLAMHWERVELHAAEKRAQYWPALKGEPVKVDDRAAMREVIEAMRPIVDSALRYADAFPHATNQALSGSLLEAVRSNRERLGLAMAAWEGEKPRESTTVDVELSLADYDVLKRGLDWLAATTYAEQIAPGLVAVLARLLDGLPSTAKDDESRCAVCGWPLARDRIAGVDVPSSATHHGSPKFGTRVPPTPADGCIRGNCSMRPRPDRLYAPERAAREATS